MWRTFNNGIEMILVVKTGEAEDVLIRLQELGERAYLIGEIQKRRGQGRGWNLSD